MLVPVLVVVRLLLFVQYDGTCTRMHDQLNFMLPHAYDNRRMGVRLFVLPWLSSSPTARDHRCFSLSGKRKHPMFPVQARVICPLG